MGTSFSIEKLRGTPINFNLCKILSKKYNIKTFVETGTFEADCVRSLSNLNIFDKLITIENSEYFYNKCVSLYSKDFPKIEWIYGNSIDFLPNIIKTLDTDKSIFWLDAHPNGENTEGYYKTHPIIDELNIVSTAPTQHILLIDDAICYTSRCGYPEKHQYPSLDVIIPLIIQKYKYKVAIIYDCIVCLPEEDDALFVDPFVCNCLDHLYSNPDFDLHASINLKCKRSV